MKLNFGCGRTKRHLEGFVNVDVRPDADLVLDVVKDPWPWAPGSVERVESYHFMEHVTEEEGRQIIFNSFIILRPGGVFVAETPDMEALCAKFPSSTRMAMWGIFGRPDTGCGMGHLWGYSAATWKLELTRAGFVGVVTGPGTDYHHSRSSPSVRVEARKP